MRAKMIYLACPYSHKDPEVMRYRFELSNRLAAWLMQEGYLVFSPLSHSVPIEPYLPNAPNDHAFWLKQDFAWLRHCEELHVIMTDGWDQSIGVAEEIRFATYISIPIVYHSEDEVRA